MRFGNPKPALALLRRRIVAVRRGSTSPAAPCLGRFRFATSSLRLEISKLKVENGKLKVVFVVVSYVVNPTFDPVCIIRFCLPRLEARPFFVL